MTLSHVGVPCIYCGAKPSDKNYECPRNDDYIEEHLFVEKIFICTECLSPIEEVNGYIHPCKKCSSLSNDAAQQSMHLTAFWRGLAWVTWGVVTLLSILFLIIGGR